MRPPRLFVTPVLCGELHRDSENCEFALRMSPIGADCGIST